MNTSSSFKWPKYGVEDTKMIEVRKLGFLWIIPLLITLLIPYFAIAQAQNGKPVADAGSSRYAG